MILGTMNLLKMGYQGFTPSNNIRISNDTYLDGSAGAQYLGHGPARYRIFGNFPGQPVEYTEALAEWDKLEANIGKKILLTTQDGTNLGEGFISGEYTLDYSDLVGTEALLISWRLAFTVDGPKVEAA